MMRKWVLLAVAVILTQAWTRAGDPLPDTAPVGPALSVHGTVERQGPYEVTPAIEATVELTSETLGERVALTDDTGGFDFYKLQPGQYDLTVHVRDALYLYKLTIDGGQTATILKPIVLGDWVYYGNRALPTSPNWTALWFKKLSGDSQALPEEGDIVIPTEELSIRQGPIFRRGKDLLLQRATGKELVPGERLKVLEVRPPFPGSPIDMEDGSVWIRFLKLR